MKTIIFIFTMVLVGFNSSVIAQIPVYGLDGWGSVTLGGQGGRIIRVTNLNASGTGSFKDALSQVGKRLIVFEVGGTIDLLGQTISIKEPHLTIAGQTAPSPGINLFNGSVSIQTHDVIFQHIRLRVGAASHEIGWEKDGISTYVSHNIVIDHCSISWAVDENCSVSGPRFNGATPDEWRDYTSHDITISNCILAEGLSNATHSKGEHSKGSLIHDNATNISILKNLYISNNDRNPLFKGGSRGIIVNNYIHNPGTAAIKFGLIDSEWIGYEWQEAQMSVVGNVLQYGPNTNNIALVKANAGPCSIYLGDNIARNRLNQNMTIYSGNSANLVSSPPIWNANVALIKAENVKDYLVNQAGAQAWDRDPVDIRLVNEVIDGEGKIIDFETEVGGFPTLETSNFAFEEDDWNLDHMIKKTSLIKVEAEKESYNVNKPIQIIGQINEFSKDMEYLELLVNGKPFGQLTESPFEWEYISDTFETLEFQIIFKEKNGRLSISDPKIISILEPLSVNNYVENHFNFNVYNQPTSNSVMIYLTGVTSKAIYIQLSNLLGQILKEEHFFSQSSNKQEFRLNTLGFPEGFYNINLKIEGKSINKKIIIVNK